MRWYSIKTHVPPAYQYVLIRAVKYDGEYDNHFIGMIEDFTKIEDLSAWEFNSINAATSTYKVTHFCILDPVEIEEDDENEPCSHEIEAGPSGNKCKKCMAPMFNDIGKDTNIPIDYSFTYKGTSTLCMDKFKAGCRHENIEWDYNKVLI